IRHLLNHTSGLRDWGSVAAVEGWPRGSRVHTHEHMLDIAVRQQALNYPPGEHYSYTNTGYNLQAVLVERVSGVPFAEFSRTHIFEPLGLSSTQWRDDFARIVENRSIGYRPAPGGAWRWDMPFENVHGNGGLLTTVEDLLRWTESLEKGDLGGAAFVQEMHRQGVLNSGRTIAYASGLVVGEYKGVSEVSHGGATAGYRAYLARYPDHEVAVALLCNAANANPGMLAHQVADLYLADAIATGVAADADGEDAPEAAWKTSPETLGALAGLYRNTRSNAAARLVLEEGTLRLEDGPPLRAVGERRFQVAGGPALVFAAARAGERASFHVVAPDGDSVLFVPVAEGRPTAAELQAYAGTYHSDEAEATFTVAVEEEGLTLRRRFGRTLPLTPLYADAFDSSMGPIRFLRDASGRIEALATTSSRVWDLRFERQR
ncbi:MAG TPA: serine hydrolase domain-containing protein, partial [Longimicrobiales bacterium]|nr:serine hydrolase domain-containing protein [Longimicrobiales bacterium]